jgi:hypothetical protein
MDSWSIMLVQRSKAIKRVSLLPRSCSVLACPPFRTHCVLFPSTATHPYATTHLERIRFDCEFHSCIWSNHTPPAPGGETPFSKLHAKFYSNFPIGSAHRPVRPNVVDILLLLNAY